MHEPPPFIIEDRDALFGLIAAHPLALVIAPDDAGFVSADLIPFALDRAAMRLRGHVARANPLAERLLRGPLRVMAVFQGPQAYVSPSHYPSKAEHGGVVPTWNYAMVQAEGVATALDAEALGNQLDALVDAQESSRESPWSVADAPEAYIAAQTRAILGVEIAISSLRGKFKLSQNRRPEDRAGVIAGLAAETQPQAQAVADIMSALRSNRT